MKLLFAIGLFFWCSCGSALVSPFPSTVPGVSLPNAHVVTLDEEGEPRLFRGMAPYKKKHYDELVALGITRVVIFKTVEPSHISGSSNDVGKEKSEWRKRGFVSPKEATEGDAYYVHRPFPWKDHGEFRGPCRETVKALQELRDAIEGKEKLFFHCTVGEDRTGYLSALFLLLISPDASVSDLFVEEMCQHGYEHGNPRKAAFVVNEIREDLTPLFMKMAYKIKSRRLTWDRLSLGVCNHDPKDESVFSESEKWDASQYTCSPSSLYDPSIGRMKVMK